jgi:type I restriction enzyme M protein
VLAEYKKITSTKVDPDVLLKAKFELPFYNTSRWTFASLIGDPDGVADNLVDYLKHISPNVRDVFEGFGMLEQIANLAKSDRLYLIVKEFAPVDVHPKVVSGHADDSP